MRNLKKLLALVLAVAMVFSLALSSFAKDIADYDDAAAAADTLKEYKELEAVYSNAVQLMIDLGVIVGTGGNNVDLGKLLSRAEFTVMLYKALNGGIPIETNEPSYALASTPFFTDVPKGNWFFAYANWAGTTGISAGVGNGRFGPNDVLTLDQALLLVMKSLGLDTEKEKNFTFTNANVTGLAYQLGLLGDLITQNDKGQINRATACLLFDYMIFAEQVRYSVITGERYRTGDTTVVGSWGTQNNPSWTLAEKKFNLVTGAFTVISDGAWFALPTITEGNFVDGSRGLTANGKAIIQRRVTYIDDYGNEVFVRFETYTLSAEVTEKLGIKLEDVGRKINVSFRSPANPNYQDVAQAFGNRSYADSEVILNDIVNDDNAAGNSSISRRLNSNLGKSNYTNPAYGKIFVNYMDAVTAMNNDGKPNNETSWMYSVTFSGITWPNTTDTTNAFSAIIKAYNNNTDVDASAWTNLQKVNFAKWFNANRASTDPAAISINVDFGSYNYNNAKTRVVYDEGAIRFVFIENYTPAVFDKVSSDKLQLKQTDRYGHNVETKNIKDFGAVEWEENDRVLIYNIGSKFGIRPVTETVTGTVSDVYGNGGTAGSDPDNGEKIVVNGTTYEAGSMGNGMYLDGVSGAYPGRFSKNWVGQEVTMYLFNGRVFNITGPSAAPAKYALVIKSALIVDNNPFTGGNTYQVELLLEDGTRGVYTLTGITGATKQSPAGTTTLNGGANAQWGSRSTSAADTGDQVYLRLDTNTTFVTNSVPIDGKIFAYSISGSNASLTPLDNRRTATPNDGALTPVTDYSGYWNATWGAGATGRLITEKTVTFVRVENAAGEETYKVFTGRTIPKVTVVATNKLLQFYLGDLNGNLSGTGAAVRLAYLNAGDNGSSIDVSRTNWAVALEYVWNSYNAETGKTRQAIRAMLPSGEVVLMYTKDSGTAFTSTAKTLARGVVFEYYGPETAVETAYTLDNDASDLTTGSTFLYLPTATSNVVVTGSNGFYAGNAYQVYTSSAKFYFVNSSGTGASDAKQITAAEAAALGFSSGTWGVSYFRDGNGHATTVIFVKYSNNAGASLPAATTPRVVPQIYTVSVPANANYITINAPSGKVFAAVATSKPAVTLTDVATGGAVGAYFAIVSADKASIKISFGGVSYARTFSVALANAALNPAAATTGFSATASAANTAAADIIVSKAFAAGDNTLTIALDGEYVINDQTAPTGANISTYFGTVSGGTTGITAIADVTVIDTKSLTLTFDKAATAAGTVSVVIRPALFQKTAGAGQTIGTYDMKVAATDLTLTASAVSGPVVQGDVSKDVTVTSGHGKITIALVGTGDWDPAIDLTDPSLLFEVTDGLQGSATIKAATMASNRITLILDNPADAFSAANDWTVTVLAAAFDSSGDVVADIVAVSGTTTSGVSAAIANANPTAGASNLVTLTLTGDMTTFDGDLEVTLAATSIASAGDGSYGTLDGQAITTTGLAIPVTVTFTNGSATVDLVLTGATSVSNATYVFSVAGLSTPAAGAVTVTTVVAGAAASIDGLVADLGTLTTTQALSTATSYNASMATATVKDQYGNAVASGVTVDLTVAGATGTASVGTTQFTTNASGQIDLSSLTVTNSVDELTTVTFAVGPTTIGTFDVTITGN